MAPIKVGDKISDVGFHYLDEKRKIQTLFNCRRSAGKKVVVVAVPGAFTLTCSTEHVPSFLDNAAALKANDVSTIYCVSVNDPFVMKQWADSLPNSSDIVFLGDGSAVFTKALGMDLDLSEKGLGMRSNRLEVKVANIEWGQDSLCQVPRTFLKALN